MAEAVSPVKLGKRAATPERDFPRGKRKKKKQPQVVTLGKSEGCKRKIAMLVSYNGAGYYGVQINPGFPTIESEFFAALVKVGAVPEDHISTPSKMWFQRGSRTDKGVSAAGQIFSLKAVLVPDLVTKLNENLPAQIQVMGYIRTTNGFDSKNFCDSRTYMYMMPTFAFAPLEKFVTDEYRCTGDIVTRVREILQIFLGTHNYHNFTSGVKFEQAKAKRYIISFECSEPYIREGLEFVTLRIKGQSFMLHQIRKMIGLTIAILRGYCGIETVHSCWGPDKVDVPKAPGLGLVLEELHFSGYNKKFGCDGLHESIDWNPYKDPMDKFKEEHIISYIAAQEKSERCMFNWLRTLQFHNFDQPPDEGPAKPWVKVAKLLENKTDVSVNQDSGLAARTDLNTNTSSSQVDNSVLPQSKQESAADLVDMRQSSSIGSLDMTQSSIDSLDVTQPSSIDSLDVTQPSILYSLNATKSSTSHLVEVTETSSSDSGKVTQLPSLDSENGTEATTIDSDSLHPSDVKTGKETEENLISQGGQR